MTNEFTSNENIYGLRFNEALAQKIRHAKTQTSNVAAPSGHRWWLKYIHLALKRIS